MTTIALALLPLLFVVGCLTWTLSMGAREQRRADEWAERWQLARVPAGRPERH